MKISRLKDTDFTKEINKILMVTSLYHMKRSKLISDIMMPPHFKTFCCPAKGYITKENWESDHERKRKTLREAKMMRQMVIDGLIPDFEV